LELYDAYYLGGSIEYLKNIQEFSEVIVKERKKGNILLLDILRQISKDLDEYEISDIIAVNVDFWITKLRREYKAGQKLKESEAKDLSINAEKLDEMLTGELLNRPIIELTGKGALNQQALLETSEGNPSAIFSKKIWKKLPTIAKSDFSDAAKCLLVKASTPATMVALRGLEAIMRDYYCFRTENECGKKALGTVLRELKSLPDAKGGLLGYIDYLRSEKRNLAQHPDRTFNQKEAERIFMEIINAVHDVYSVMDTK
jgi:hypothetical protein